MFNDRTIDRRHLLRGMAVLGAAGLGGWAASPAFAAPPRNRSAAPEDWMSGIADDTTVDDLTIPGTHNSCAVVGGPFDTAKCQDLSLPDLLTAGVRFIDIRCRLVDGGFAIHHGPVYQEKNFTDVLTDCRDFLSAHPGETVLMSMQQEYSEAPEEEFAGVFNDRYLADEGFDALLFRDARIPRLGEVRGKVILIANIGGIGGLPAGDTGLLAYQNDWEAPTAEKWDLIRRHLDDSEAEHTGSTRLFVNYTSTTTGELIPNPHNYAAELNPKTRQYVRDALGTGAHPVYGAVVMDFAGTVEPDLVPALIDCNG